MKNTHVTVVYRLSEDPVQRKAFMDSIKLGNIVEGAEITAASVDDEMTILLMMESDLRMSPSIVADARRKTVELHQQCSTAAKNEVVAATV